MDHASLLQALPFPHAPCGNDLSFSAAFDAIQEARRADDRLAYVAVTRARQHLVATTHAWSDLKKPRDYSPYLRVLDAMVAASATGPRATMASSTGGISRRSADGRVGSVLMIW